MAELVKKTEGFSGAEIEEVVNEALFNAYANGQKDLEMQNLLDCIAAVLIVTLVVKAIKKKNSQQ